MIGPVSSAARGGELLLNVGDWRIADEPAEVESGKRNVRPKLQEAMQACRVYGAKLVIAKLDRLFRNTHFLLGLEKADVDLVAADMFAANGRTVGIMAMVADEERRMISTRTRAALAAAKKRGVKLGGYRASAKRTRKSSAANPKGSHDDRGTKGEQVMCPLRPFCF